MPQLYTVGRSPGKGTGVFATRDIEPGTTLLAEKPAIRLNKMGSRLKETHVERAVERLSSEDQRRFDELHAGHRPYKSRRFRIYKANSFGSQTDGTQIYLEISRFNHSCVPNAEIDHPGDTGQPSTVFAIKPIRTGEEICISYNGDFVRMTKAQRAAILGVYYGFACDCPACNYPTRYEQYQSDWRRNLINVLSCNVDGYEAMDTAQYEKFAEMTPAEAESPEILAGTLMYPLQTPLRREQICAYSYLLARLLEAENYAGSPVTSAYNECLQWLGNQLVDQNEFVLVTSAKFAEFLMKRLLQETIRSRGTDSRLARQLIEMKEHAAHKWPSTRALKLLRSSTFPNDVFAIHLGMPTIRDGIRGRIVTTWTEEEYKAMIREHGEPYVPFPRQMGIDFLSKFRADPDVLPPPPTSVSKETLAKIQPPKSLAWMLGNRGGQDDMMSAMNMLAPGMHPSQFRPIGGWQDMSKSDVTVPPEILEAARASRSTARTSRPGRSTRGRPPTASRPPNDPWSSNHDLQDLHSLQSQPIDPNSTTPEAHSRRLNELLYQYPARAQKAWESDPSR